MNFANLTLALMEYEGNVKETYAIIKRYFFNYSH